MIHTALDDFQKLKYFYGCINCEYYHDKCFYKAECVWKRVEKDLELLNWIREVLLHERIQNNNK